MVLRISNVRRSKRTVWNCSPLFIRGSGGATNLPVVDDKRDVRSGAAVVNVVSGDFRGLGVSL